MWTLVSYGVIILDKKKSFLVFGLVAIVAISITGVSALMLQIESIEPAYSGPPKAVIIDQLSDEFPNDFFHQEAIKYLVNAGYEVDTVYSKDVTVDFYKSLPQNNYKIVVVRTHGADSTQGDSVVLFTGEKYTEDKYIQEQLFGQVTKAAPVLEVAYKPANEKVTDWVIVNDTYSYLKSSVKKETTAENAFFAISPKLVSDSMKGKFHDTLFVLGGCNTLSNTSLANSLFQKGASAVVGWDNKVGSTDNDTAILYFLDLHLNKDMEIDESVNTIKNVFNQGLMPYPANFTHYQNTV